MFGRRSMVVCAALALAAGGAGCGSDGESTTAASGDGGPLKGAPIVVGTTGPYTSDVIALPEARSAVEAAAKAINAAGGIDGRPLKIEACDDHLDPNQAAACGRKFADDDTMVATAGSVSIQGDHYEPAIEQGGLADVGGYPVAAATLTSPVSFPLQGGTYIQYAGAATVIADRGYKRPVVIYHDIPTIKVVLQAIDTTLSASGLEVAGKVAISPTATDMSAAVAKARTYDPDVVLLAFPEPQISQAIQTEFQTGNRLPLITGAGDLSAAALKKLGPAAEGVTSLSALPPQSADGVPAIDAFHADMEKYAPDAERSAISLNAWAGVQLLADVLRGLDRIDRASVLKAMNELSDYDSGGLTPALDFTAKPAVAGLPRLFNTSATVTRITDGTQHWDGKFLKAAGGLIAVLQFVILGLGVGAIYALGALGIVAIHRGSKVLNLAHGGVAMWGAFLFVGLRDDHGVPAWAAAAVAVAAGAAFGALAYLAVLRPLRHRPPVTQVVATLGLLVVLVGLASRSYGTDATIVASWLPNGAVTIAGASVGRDRIFLLAIALAATCALALWSARSRTALMTRALAEHERGAVALGASPTVLGALNWALGCALAALAGVLLVPILGLGVTTIPTILVPALAAALLGRFDSYWWALAGGLVIGVTESLVTRYVSVSGLSSTVPLVVVVLVLLARRDSGANRLAAAPAQSVPSGRLNLPLAGAAVAGVAALVAFGSAVWIDAAVTTMTYGLLGLSLVVLIGYANQISLAQMAIAGLSAFVVIKLAIAIEVPFLLAPPLGALVGAAAGVVIGLPAVRIRGINLAVVTLATGLAVQQSIFNNEAFNGGIGGLVPPAPRLFGLSVDGVGHPTRYALFVLAWTCLGVAAVWLIRRSRFGSQLIAVRTNERAAAALGIEVWRVKLTAFAASSALAGLAGVLVVYRQPSATFEPFSTGASFQLITFAIIGGVAAISGGLAAGLIAPAGLIFTGLDHVGLVTGDTAIVLGLIMLVALRIHPNGLAVWRHPKPEPGTLGRASTPARPPAPLTAAAVRVRFGGVPAVDGADVAVAPGEVVGLVGPNGAGKTSLLDAITGFADSSGTIALGDRTLDGSGPSERARAGVGRMFQSLELFEDLSVGQNLELATGAGATRGVLPASAWAAIDRFGLADDLGRRPGELPQARRKSVALARTLACDPAVLLLDEPGAGLSAEAMRTLAAEVRAVAGESGIGVLIVDHDMGLVLEACDRLVVMAQGRVLAEGDPREVLAQRDVRDAYLGEIAASEVLA